MKFVLNVIFLTFFIVIFFIENTLNEHFAFLSYFSIGAILLILYLLNNNSDLNFYILLILGFFLDLLHYENIIGIRSLLLILSWALLTVVHINSPLKILHLLSDFVFFLVLYLSLKGYEFDIFNFFIFVIILFFIRFLKDVFTLETKE
ncbi:MAG: hypothetical protein N3A71_03840 [Candidatus Dojkabacteria bacterium]|nr:hypothetical protein [Candidatus Dojkabacteria bacterium]